MEEAVIEFYTCSCKYYLDLNTCFTWAKWFNSGFKELRVRSATTLWVDDVIWGNE